MNKPADPASGTDPTTIAGAAAFVAGGVGTIVAAIGSFGADDSALAAARRNHVWELVVAAAAAALGLMLGGLYAIVRDGASTEPTLPTTGGERIFNGPRRFLKWMRANNGRRILGAGVIAVALGVGLGTYATTNRQPGKPTIAIERVNDESVRVEITAEGLPSSDWYDAVLRGYSDSSVETDGVFLASARFSPLNPRTHEDPPPDRAGKPIQTTS